MSNDLDIILSALSRRLAADRDWLEPPYLYLDPQAVSGLFQQLTGLSGPPGVRLSYLENLDGVKSELCLEPGQGFTFPDHIIYDCLAPVLEKKIPALDSREDLDSHVNRYARIKGLLQTTRFPDGELNLEIVFTGVRGLIFYHQEFFNSMVRPVVDNDRFYSLSNEIEGLVYILGPVRTTIFYHQIYGDNQEHLWLPLVPVVLKHLPAAADDEAFSE